jgi:organic hydroperoxide reductase OsmC/OhrA
MIELVWDAGRLGTATSPTGMTVTVGEKAHFSPDDLLALSAASCLMRTFLRLAEEDHTPILSYVATARAAPACESNAEAHVTVHAYLVAASGDDVRDLQDRFDRSVRVSPIAQLLGDRITVTSEMRVLCPAESAD